MAAKIIMAVAGAGKTYKICHDIDPEQKNLLLAFTHQNIHNITSELYNIFGIVPEKTRVMTFHSFLYSMIVRPYIKTIMKHFGEENIKINGITMKEPPSKTIGKRPNSAYISQNLWRHYVDKYNNLYCASLAELINVSILKHKDDRNRILQNIDSFFDKILIDEFQDYRKNEYDILISMIKKLSNVELVGDFYQHSVSGSNTSGKPYDNSITYEEYTRKLPKKVEIDDMSMNLSRRCTKSICDFISSKLGINIKSAEINNGKVIIVTKREDAEMLLTNDNIVKLVYQDSKNKAYRAVNWSYSKGDTYDVTCVILTDSTNGIIKDDFVNNIRPVTRNKLYVALTRSRGDVYIVPNGLIDNYF